MLQTQQGLLTRSGSQLLCQAPWREPPGRGSATMNLVATPINLLWACALNQQCQQAMSPQPMLSPTTGEQQCTTEVRQRSFSAHMARVVDDALPDRIKWPRMSPHAQHAQMGLTCLLISHHPYFWAHPCPKATAVPMPASSAVR